MSKELLLKFADWLEKNIKVDQFDLSVVVSEFNESLKCGSVCCAIGWLPKFAETNKINHKVDWYHVPGGDGADLKLNGHRKGYDIIADTVFNLPSGVGELLFCPLDNSLDETADDYGFEVVEIDNGGGFAIDDQNHNYDVPRCVESAEPREIAAAIRWYVDNCEPNQ